MLQGMRICILTRPRDQGAKPETLALWLLPQGNSAGRAVLARQVLAFTVIPVPLRCSRA